MTRYQRNQVLRRAMLAHKYPERNRADYMVGAVGIVGCVVIVILAAAGVV